MGAALLDVDGTLIDSTDVYRRIWQTWAAGHALDFEVVWAATHGRRPVETFADVAPHLDPDDEYTRIRALLAAEGDVFRPLPGAPELLAALAPGQWALVTSAPLDSVTARFRLAGLPVPAVIVDGDSVANGKPAPDAYLRAAERLGVPVTECLVVEDAPAGIAAGRAAGMRVLAVASTHPAELLVEAHQCFPSLVAASATITEWCAR